MLTIYVNAGTSPAALLSKPSGSPISALRLKRGATVPLSVILLGVEEASGLRFGTKAKNDFEGELLLFAEAAEGTPTEGGVAFNMEVVVNSDTLNALLLLGSGNAAPASVAAISEFSWMEGGSARISDTLTTTIQNDVLRLATEGPNVQAGYPDAPAVATKSWVSALRASSSAAGLVQLESDAIIENADHTAVALTSAGALAVPAAGVDQRGTVKLGTSTPISGSGVLLVGETSNGRLAVSASGLTAYALAKENGYEGSEQEWLASLKGDPGEKGAPGADGLFIVGQPTVTGALQNFNSYWWKLSGIYNPGGLLTRYDLPTRTSSAVGMVEEPVYLAVWYEPASGSPVCLGRSSNTQTFAVNTTLSWCFEGLELPAGRPLRFCLLREAQVEEGSALWANDNCIGLRVASRPAGDSVSTVNGTSVGTFTVACTLYTPLESMAPYVRRSEIAGLLEHQSELLALLGAAPMSLSDDSSVSE